MPTRCNVGEVWWADLGRAAKSRPVLILAAPRERDARQLVVVAPLTSQIRGLPGEVALGPVRWLPKPSAVNVQGLASFDPGKLIHRLGLCTPDQMEAVKQALRELLDL
ncbi:MAG: type II toxin-antitoxin system PemK/MazF family toxin [Kiritimatiellae bacterium]|nr:type II toxin-antitoxin system PemK/MazF family toxin [Kiritimatiellia bacterium]